MHNCYHASPSIQYPSLTGHAQPSMPHLHPLLRLPPALRTVLAQRQSLPNIQARIWAHPFASSAYCLAKNLPPRRVIHDEEIEENFLKGSGPGGQKINKTSSAVQLKHLATGIVVKYQDTRSRSLNRKRARQILGEKLEELEKGEESRTRIKAREKSKKKASAGKKSRRKYRALEVEKLGMNGEGDDVDDSDVETHVETIAKEGPAEVAEKVG